MWRLVLVFALGMIWMEEGTRTPTHPNTYVPSQGRYCQTGMAWSPEAPQSQRDVRYLTVCLWATSFLLASETLSHYWPCDLTLSKSFTQSAAHCWALKVSGHKHRGSFPLNGGELWQHRHKHLWRFIPSQEISKCRLTWTMEQFITLSEHPHIFIFHLWTQCLVLSATAVSINGLSCTEAWQTNGFLFFFFREKCLHINCKCKSTWQVNRQQTSTEQIRNWSHQSTKLWWSCFCAETWLSGISNSILKEMTWLF